MYLQLWGGDGHLCRRNSHVAFHGHNANDARRPSFFGATNDAASDGAMELAHHSPLTSAEEATHDDSNPPYHSGNDTSL